MAYRLCQTSPRVTIHKLLIVLPMRIVLVGFMILSALEIWIGVMFWDWGFAQLVLFGAIAVVAQLWAFRRRVLVQVGVIVFSLALRPLCYWATPALDMRNRAIEAAEGFFDLLSERRLAEAFARCELEMSREEFEAFITDQGLDRATSRQMSGSDDIRRHTMWVGYSVHTLGAAKEVDLEICGRAWRSPVIVWIAVDAYPP